MHRIIIGMLSLVILMTSPAFAASFTITISGYVEGLFVPADSLEPEDIPFAIGDPWQVSFVIDDEAPDLWDFDPDEALYEISGFDGFIGALPISTPEAEVIIFNDTFVDDRVITQWRSQEDVFNFELMLFEIQLYTPTVEGFDEVGPLSPAFYDLSLYDLDESPLTAAFRDDALGEFYNTQLFPERVDVTPLAAVPVPGALVLLGSATLALMGWRGRRTPLPRLS